MQKSSIAERCDSQQIDFELFKSNVCHRVKVMGDFDYIMDALENDIVRAYYNKQRYAECFYLLAMLDYLSRENNIPLCSNYQDIRSRKLKEMIYPRSILAMAAVFGDEQIKEKAQEKAISEFLRFNIIENDNVICA